MGWEAEDIDAERSGVMKVIGTSNLRPANWSLSGRWLHHQGVKIRLQDGLMGGDRYQVCHLHGIPSTI
eukprot:1597691-Amphidinium_carterae.4